MYGVEVKKWCFPVDSVVFFKLISVNELCLLRHGCLPKLNKRLCLNLCCGSQRNSCLGLFHQSANGA